MTRAGVMIPLVTPVTSTGAVCAKSVARLVACSRHTATGYLPCLTSGEGWALSDTQWEDMVRHTVACAGEAVVVAGVERATTEHVLELARRAKRLGARGVMLTSPFGEAVSQQAIFEHYQRVHDQVELEVYIYNESALSKNETSFETLLAIAALPRVVGIKDSSEKPRDQAQIEAIRSHSVAYYLGWEHHLATGLPADGNVVSLGNLEPALCKVACRSEDRALREEVQRLTELYGLMAPDWYRFVKLALHQRGVIDSPNVLAT